MTEAKIKEEKKKKERQSEKKGKREKVKKGVGTLRATPVAGST